MINLKHNYHELSKIDKISYLIFVRWFLKKEDRFFFEGPLKLVGQMYQAERKALYNAIIENKPRHCFEIGTFTGGGSTYFIAQAFKKLGRGKLFTIENNQRLYKEAKNYYSKYLKKLLPFVFFHLWRHF